MRVVAHAMDDPSARRAADAGVDILAHTPVRPLSDEAVAAWARPERAVISSLTAFGAGADALTNLRRLHEAGARILYGTDLGNRRVAGVDAEELRLLSQVGLSPGEILAACTHLPAAVWGLEGLGQLAPGAPAHFLVLDGDPHDDPTLLARPRAVYIGGHRRRPRTIP
jgi:imidazolonepropionase-like amidohydrolase